MICHTCQREIAEYSNFCYYCGSRQSAAPPPPSSKAGKRLVRSVTDVKIAGVCGGVAEYLEVDPTLVRLVWVILVLLPVPVVPAILGYLVAWIVMPKAPAPVPAAAAPQSSTTHAAQSS